MTCETGRMLLEQDSEALAEHLQSCVSCAIGVHGAYYEAPQGLEEKVRRDLRREVEAASPWRAWAIAASVMLAASLAGNLTLFQSRVSPRQVAADAVLSAHIRSLTGTHLMDILSSDQHTVKPWFNGKIDFSPPVRTVDGFPLLGGRLEYLGNRPAAALVYGRNKHVINLFVWPSNERAAETISTRNGYHIENWNTGGMTFWAVSDLNGTDLQHFVSLYRKGP